MDQRSPAGGLQQLRTRMESRGPRLGNRDSPDGLNPWAKGESGTVGRSRCSGHSGLSREPDRSPVRVPEHAGLRHCELTIARRKVSDSLYPASWWIKADGSLHPSEGLWDRDCTSRRPVKDCSPPL